MSSWASTSTVGPATTSNLTPCLRLARLSVLLVLLCTDLAGAALTSITWTSLPRTSTTDSCLLCLLVLLALNSLHCVLLLTQPPVFLSLVFQTGSAACSVWLLPYLLSLPVPAAALLSVLAADPVLRLAALVLFTARNQPGDQLQEPSTRPERTQCQAYKVREVRYSQEWGSGNSLFI